MKPRLVQKTALSATLLMLCAGSFAQQGFIRQSAEDNLEFRPQFTFQTQNKTLGAPQLDIELWDDEKDLPSHLLENTSTYQGSVKEYDAKFLYGLGGESFNFDLGLNLKFIDADLKSSELNSQPYRINATLPMLHASALFDLPLDGLSASLSGSHSSYDQFKAFDYKAKLKFQWDNGLGLEGGWQHQQLNVDNGQEVDSLYDIQGPFIDLKYRF